MFLKKIRISITKIILPFLYKILQLLKANTRTVNFLNNKKINANNSYNFQTNIESLLKNKKLIGLDVGAQGGFNSDKFFPKKYNKYFKSILVDPLKESFKGSIKIDSKYLLYFSGKNLSELKPPRAPTSKPINFLFLSNFSITI